MNKNSKFEKFRPFELKEASEVKGGVRANYSGNGGGSGGTGFIDWGSVDVIINNGLQFSKEHLFSSFNSNSIEP